MRMSMRRSELLSVSFLVSAAVILLLLSVAASAAITTNSRLITATPVPTINPILSTTTIPAVITTPVRNDSDGDDGLEDGGTVDIEPPEDMDTISRNRMINAGNVTVVPAADNGPGMLVANPVVTHNADYGSVISPELVGEYVQCIEEPDSKMSLECPQADSLVVDWPDRPYDFAAGDCMIKGKETEVRAYIDALKIRLMDCYDGIPQNVEDFDAEKKSLIDDMKALPAYDPNCEIEAANAQGGGEHMGQMTISEPSLPIFMGCQDMPGLGSHFSDDDGDTFTRLLMSMEEAVNKTCQASMVLDEDLVCLCEDIAGHVNNKEWLWPNEKNSLISEIEHVNVELANTQDIARITVDWFMYMNNSWNAYYDPEYVQPCGAGQLGDMMSPSISRALKLINSGMIGPEEKQDVYETFAIAVIETDSKVEDLKVNEDGFELKYRKDAKVLGFIPAKYTLVINASDEKVISARKPWWVSISSNDAEETIGSIDEELSIRLNIQMERRQKIIQTLSNIMKKIGATMGNQTQNIK